MNKSLIIFLIIQISFCTCKQNKFLSIEGNVDKVNARKVYLVEASKFMSFLDSSSYSENHFAFKIPMETYSGMMMSIAYVDSNTKKIHTLDFINNILSTKEQGYRYNAFVVGKENISISGLANIREYLIPGTLFKHRDDSINIKAGIETDALYATQMMNFGYLEGDISARTKSLNDYLTIIKKYPTSRYLLSEIDVNKSVLKKEELVAMLNAFNKECLLSGIGKKLKIYSEKKAAINVLENYKLSDENGNGDKIIDPSAKVIMIVLWASWCGPCRAEIPEIKKLYEKYHDKGLSIVSISTDKKSEDWKKTLAIEQMKWRQLIVPDSLKESFSQKFEVSAIPDIIFTDSKGSVIQRMIGYEENVALKYEAVIQKQLGEN